MIVKVILLGTLLATSYRPVAWQTSPGCTDRQHCVTAIGENVSELGVAVSRDLLQSGEVHYGDLLWIDRVGWRIVNDTMGPKARQAIDVFVYTYKEEKSFGIKHLKVYRIEVTNGQ